MKIITKKIASFSQHGTNLKLISIDYFNGIHSGRKYQVQLNRKVIKTSISEYECRKIFAVYTQNIVLQLKIY